MLSFCVSLYCIGCVDRFIKVSYAIENINNSYTLNLIKEFNHFDVINFDCKKEGKIINLMTVFNVKNRIIIHFELPK